VRSRISLVLSTRILLFGKRFGKMPFAIKREETAGKNKKMS